MATLVFLVVVRNTHCSLTKSLSIDFGRYEPNSSDNNNNATHAINPSGVPLRRHSIMYTQVLMHILRITHSSPLIAAASNVGPLTLLAPDLVLRDLELLLADSQLNNIPITILNRGRHRFQRRIDIEHPGI